VTAYTLHSGATYGLANAGNSSGFTFGVQFSVSQTVTLTGIWFYSPSGAIILPSACAIYNLDNTTQVAGTLNSSPSWSGAAASGWVKCSYSSPSLTSGIHYAACVYSAGGSNWWPDVSGYWSSGGGSGGITNGPLSAPNTGGSVLGQAPYTVNVGISCPSTSNPGYDWGVDVEVTVSAAAVAAGLSQAVQAKGLKAPYVLGRPGLIYGKS
jgi:hypothetical protein